MNTLTKIQLDCILDALNTFVCISFDTPTNSEEKYQLIGKWLTIKRILAELYYDNEYFEEAEATPYHMPFEWGEKLFLHKTPLELLDEVLCLSRDLSPALDSDAACFRVFLRTIAELAGKELRPYRLLRESGPVTPMYCKDPIKSCCAPK